jgi:DNA-binding transcriptional MerR regulator
MDAMSIGALAKVTGVKVPTIRFYEQIGLLPAPLRTPSNRRSYGQPHQQRLRFIRHARDLGFAVDDIRELLAMSAAPQASCERADSIAQRHLGEVERRIAQLRSLRSELKRMIGECRHGRIAECRVIESLADHGSCLNDDHGARM